MHHYEFSIDGIVVEQYALECWDIQQLNEGIGKMEMGLGRHETKATISRNLMQFPV